MKKPIILLMGILFAITSYAQVGVGTTTPNSTLDIRGSVATNYRAFTTTATATATDNILLFTGTAATTITLPTAVGCDGRNYIIKNASTTGPTPILTIATTAAQTIDGAASWSLTSANETITIISNGANWYISAQSLPGGSGTSWSQNGNSVPSLKTIGTITNYALPFITNNTEKMRLTTTGSLGIGATTFNTTYPEKLLVDAGTTTSVNTIVGKGSIDSYLQLNIQNNSSGNNASSDVVATANNGDETSNYVDMGINGGSYTGGVMGGANDGYLYTMGNNFLLGTGNASKSLVFMTGGTSQATNERMRIDGNGNVGIGVTNPAYKLHVAASSNPLFLSGVQTGANTDSIVTINNGVVRKLLATALPASANAWSILGNAGTNPTSNFIGTTDANALVVKENNTQVGRFEANAIALGNGATTNNATHSYALGSLSNIGFGKTQSYAIGHSASVTADNGLAIGNSAITNGSNSFAIGNSAAANNTNSIALGYTAVTAYGISDATAIGTNATANASNSIAIGSNATLGSKTVTNANNAIAIGTTAVSNSVSSIALGTGANTAYSITPAVAIGNAATVSGNSGIAIGNGANVGTVANAMALGTGASATITAAYSTAIGYNASATLPNEIILGDRSNVGLSVGIGTESFSSSNREKLLVDAGTAATSVNAIVGKGTIDSYLQLNIQNNSAGTSSSSDVVATANNGNETSNYIDMGINGGNYAGGIMGAANDGYLYTMGNNFLIGTANASKSVVFLTGGTTQATNERMRIDGNGNVGIGTNLPTANFHVATAATGTNTIAQFLSPALTTTNAAYLKIGKSLTIGDEADIAFNWISANSSANYLGFGFYSKPIAMAVTNGGNVGIGTTTPASTLEVNGSQALPIATKTGTYMATASDYTIVCNNTAAMTVNLPAATSCTGRVYVVKKISGLSLNVIIDPNGVETIDGAGTKTLTQQYDTVMIQSNGSNWYILSN